MDAGSDSRSQGSSQELVTPETVADDALASHLSLVPETVRADSGSTYQSPLSPSEPYASDLGLHEETHRSSVDGLNQLRVDLVRLQRMEPAGQRVAEDRIAVLDERIRILGGTPIEARDSIDDLTLIHDGDDLDGAHRILLGSARTLAEQALGNGDYATALLAARFIEDLERRIWSRSNDG